MAPIVDAVERYPMDGVIRGTNEAGRYPLVGAVEGLDNMDIVSVSPG